MSTITVTSPQEIRAENRSWHLKIWWNDPEYKAIVARRIEGQSCHYCEKRPAATAHHDDPTSYGSKAEYFNPANMQPICLICHEQYRKQLIICPKCREHYLMRDGPYEICAYCRGDFRLNKKGNFSKYPHHRNNHPCGNHVGAERCQRNGFVVVCARSARKAEGCDYFSRREVTAPCSPTVRE